VFSSLFFCFHIGLLKILSKMGISLLASYHGAQIFEALGLGGDLVEGTGAPLLGTPSRVGGLDTADVGRELLVFYDRAFPDTTSTSATAEDASNIEDTAPNTDKGSSSLQRLADDGFVKPKGSKEHHSNSPQLAKVLHKVFHALVCLFVLACAHVEVQEGLEGRSWFLGRYRKEKNTARTDSMHTYALITYIFFRSIVLNV